MNMTTKGTIQTVIYGLGLLMVFALGYANSIDLSRYIIEAETRPSWYHATKARCLDPECRIWFHIIGR
jgi:hypothetical protein